MVETTQSIGKYGFDMADKLVLITGGGTGLGLQFARVLGGAGARVLLSGRRREVLEYACTQLLEEGVSATSLQMDVGSETSVVSAFESLAGDSPSVLINNAGTTSALMLDDLTVREWDRVNDTNLKGAWLAGREFVKGLDSKRSGVIVNVASVLGRSVQKGTGAYTASKAGLLHLTRQMAVEWAKFGVRANSLLPGYYNTDIAGDFLESEAGQALVKRIPQRRLGELPDLSGPILLLCSDASRYMTGSSITVDGGLGIAIV